MSSLEHSLRRASSLKKIIIASPSQDILRFLTLPNPSAAMDPRERLHILTPKSKNRSTSNSEEKSKHKQTLKKKPTNISRVTFMRKKIANYVWNKNGSENVPKKLTLSDNHQRTQSIKKSFDQLSESNSSNNSLRLDFTFGFNQESRWLKV